MPQLAHILLAAPRQASHLTFRGDIKDQLESLKDLPVFRPDMPAPNLLVSELQSNELDQMQAEGKNHHDIAVHFRVPEELIDGRLDPELRKRFDALYAAVISPRPATPAVRPVRGDRLRRAAVRRARSGT